MTHSALAEELASLVKDNLPSKHLVLSVEEALVNFLQDGTSSDGVIELEPMSSYNRLLLHRLAYIFGFAHESVGEGEDRHLIFERCPKTSIPPVLVSDILWHSDGYPPPTMSHQLLWRNQVPFDLKAKTPVQCSYEERDAACGVGEGVFHMEEERNDCDNKAREKARTIPVVARRMIAHALGKRINPLGHKEQVSMDLKEEGCQVNNPGSHLEVAEKQVGEKWVDGRVADLGAARRIFAHALGRRWPAEGKDRELH